MAIKATVETIYGATQEIYIRLNSVEASNHGVDSIALFRGFTNEEAFKSGKHFVWEKTISFKADVSRPLWVQAYENLKLDSDLKDGKDE